MYCPQSLVERRRAQATQVPDRADDRRSMVICHDAFCPLSRDSHPPMPATLRTTFRVALRGEALLTNPRFNKGTAFSLQERREFGLTGRLPFRVASLDEQCQRAYDQLNSQESPLHKNSFLQSLKDQNLVLYFALLSKHLRELIPIIYTPTEVRLFPRGLNSF